MIEDSLSYKAYLKSHYRSIKHSTYFNSYDYFLKNYIGQQITFVEIGILDGGSLFMWREFFGQNARIIGIDLNPDAKKWEKYGFEIFIGDQNKQDFWDHFKASVGKVDILLDDGGHTYEQQINTVENMIGHINDNGVLLVEDTHTSYMDGFGPKNYSFLKYVFRKIDDINYRSHLIQKSRAEYRFWSIELTESIVAFKVRHYATKQLSFETTNNGEAAEARDFRFHDAKFLSYIDILQKRLEFIKYIPFAWKLGSQLKNKIKNLKFNAKQYFK